MSVQKATEYISKAIEHLKENKNDIMDFLDEIVQDNLNKALEELKQKKKEEWELIEKCKCGNYSLCHIDQKDGTKIYLCLDCFFKYGKK